MAELKELYPGSYNEARRHDVIDRAVSAADHIILEGSDGSTEETDWLTGEVAARFVEKVRMRLASQLSRLDLHRRMQKDRQQEG